MRQLSLIVGLQNLHYVDSLTLIRLLKPIVYRLWFTIMSGLLKLVDNTWSRDDLTEGGKMAMLIREVKQAMLVCYQIISVSI